MDHVIERGSGNGSTSGSNRHEISDNTVLHLENKVLDPGTMESSDAVDLAVGSTDVLGPFVDGILPAATETETSGYDARHEVDDGSTGCVDFFAANDAFRYHGTTDTGEVSDEGERHGGGSSKHKPSCSRSSTFSERSVGSCDSFMSAESKLEPDAEREELHQMFRTFDENGDGRISREELGNTMKKLGFEMSETELLGMVTAVDKDGDGHVDFDEFLTLYSTLYWEEVNGRGNHGGGGSGDADEEELRDAFLVFDKNSDGYISVTELQGVLSCLGLKEGVKLSDCHKMITAVDKDGDGRVNFEEFKQMMSSNMFKRA